MARSLEVPKTLAMTELITGGSLWWACGGLRGFFRTGRGGLGAGAAESGDGVDLGGLSGGGEDGGAGEGCRGGGDEGAAGVGRVERGVGSDWRGVEAVRDWEMSWEANAGVAAWTPKVARRRRRQTRWWRRVISSVTHVAQRQV